MSLDRPTFERIARALRDDAGRYFPRRTVTDVEIVETIPRPYSQLARFVIRYSDGMERAYAKLYRHPRLGHEHNRSSVEREYGAHEALHRAFENIEGCGVVRPIASFAELGGWVMEEIDGRTLEQELSRKGPRWAGSRSRESLIASLDKAGLWLRHLQESFRQEGSTTLADSGILQEIDQLVENTVEMNEADKDRLRAHVSNLVAAHGTPPLPLVGQHGECYAPHHIFIRDGELLVFDITGIKYGPPYEDLANLWIGLEALRKYPVFSRSTVADLQSALLQGFSQGQELDTAAFEIYQIKNMLKLLDSIGRISVTDWRAGIRRAIGLRFVKGWLRDRS